MPDSNLHKLSAMGVSVWIDYLSRDLIHKGELERMTREDAVVGVTSNPTIFQKAISAGSAYDEQLREILKEGEADAKEIFIRLTQRDDTETDKRLEAIGTEVALALRGKLAIANAKLAYQHYLEAFAGERWDFLASKGATKQRCLWASTSTKNPAYRDVLYVEELIGPETVDTMPEETIVAFQDHGEVALTLEQDLDEAKRVFERIAEAGVDYDDVVAVLEQEGVQKFADSFAELLDGVRAKRGELVSA